MGENLQIRPSGLLPLDVRLSGLALGAVGGQIRGMSETMIETVDLHRGYRIGNKTIEVLHGVDLRIRRGERVFLCGPSGAGKTTLLYTLAGLERPERGLVRIDDVDLYALGRQEQARFRNREIGYVFQNFHLLPELTALENVAVPGAIAGLDSTEAAIKALERVGLGHRKDHLPAELSGGEQQRVAIARAIVNEPKVLFADEPTGNLDSANSAQVMSMLLELANEHAMTLVVVTHDASLAELGDRTLVIRDGAIH
jgi:predicted ABC-type transport system involved in lysophospholipase L1 biosynthesis ATPase subunit